MGNMILVCCISCRESNRNQIIVGEKYIIDCLSLYIDIDGDSYCDTYDLYGKKIGRILLKHFQSI